MNGSPATTSVASSAFVPSAHNIARENSRTVRVRYSADEEMTLLKEVLGTRREVWLCCQAVRYCNKIHQLMSTFHYHDDFARCSRGVKRDVKVVQGTYQERAHSVRPRWLAVPDGLDGVFHRRGD